MPKPKSEFEAVYPCNFYAPEELLADDQMYTVYEIARLLQDLEPDAALEPGEEEILLDWAIPWVIDHADQLVIAEPPTDADPGFYGLRTDADGASTPETSASPATNGVGETDPDGDS